MANKAFEIQNSTLRIGGVDLQAGVNSIVIPGVTRAASYKVEEVNETDVDQTYQFAADSEVVVVDFVLYNEIIAERTENLYADFTATTDDDGEIDEIRVNGQGTYTTQQATDNERNNMYAYVGASSASDRPLVPEDWIQIPFRPKMKAGTVETVGGSGGGVVVRSVNFPEGEEGDTRGTIADVGEGVLYYCTQNWNDPDAFEVDTAEQYAAGQTGGDVVFVIPQSAYPELASLVDINNPGSWSVTGELDLAGEGTWPVISITITTASEGEFNGENVWWFNVGTLGLNYPTETEQILAGSTFQLNYARPIWQEVRTSDADLGSFTIESNILSVNSGTDIYIETYETGGQGESRLVLKPQDNEAANPTRLEGSYNVGIWANTSDTKQKWLFGTDGAITFPNGTKQTTAYTGQSSSGNTAVRYVAVNNSGTIYGSTDGENWTSYASPMTDVGEVAVGPTNIVYTADNSNNAGNSLWYAAAYNSTPTEVPPAENVEENYREVKYFSSIEKYVAVGYVAEGNNFPILLHSSDGITWTRSYISEGFIAELGFTGDAEFVDIAENNLGFFIISDNNNLGSFFLENITDALDATTHVEQADDYEHVVWVETAAVEFRGWHVFDNDEDWWFNANQDPRVGSFEYFAVGDLDPVFESALGYNPGSPGEFAVGEYNGLSTIVIGTGDGQIMRWPAGEAGPFVVIPKPFTSSISDIIRGTTTTITFTGDRNSESDGEKIVISGVTTQEGEPGTTNQSYNGTYYIKRLGEGAPYTNQLYTDRALTIPWDTSGYWPVNTNTGTLTWSHGRYIDALHYSNGIFYVGNDDEEFFISTDGGATWTETDSFTVGGGEDSSYLNDIDSYGTAVADTTTVVSQDIAPIAGNGSLWFNSLEGRLYIKYSDQWVDAAPLIQPPPATDLDVNSITFADATVLTSATALTPSKLVNGANEVVLNVDGDLLLSNDLLIPRTGRIIKDCDGSGGTTSMRWTRIPEDTTVELIRAYTGNAETPDNLERAQLSVEWQTLTQTGLSITAFDRTEGEIDYKWEFRGDGSLTLPNQTVNGRAGSSDALVFSRTSLSTQKAIATQPGNANGNTVDRLVIAGGDSYYNANASEWFGEGGDIYLWAGQGANGGDLKLDAGDSLGLNGEAGGWVKMRGGDSVGSNGGYLELSGGSASWAGTIGGDITLIAGTGPTHGKIRLTSNSNNWDFGADGRTKIPHGTNGPSTARGAAGDKAGMILVSGAYLFYCYADYTDGQTPIWQKTSMDNTDWD